LYLCTRLLGGGRANFLQKKDTFPKTVNDACRIMAGWKNNYSNTSNKYTEANDGVAFVTTGKEGKNNDKKKDMKCYKSRKTAITPTNVKRLKQSNRP